MLKCKDITELASEKLDENMPFFKRLQFNMHLMVCKNCRRFMNQMQLTIHTISKIEPVQPPVELIDNQVEKLMQVTRSIRNSNI